MLFKHNLVPDRALFTFIAIMRTNEVGESLMKLRTTLLMLFITLVLAGTGRCETWYVKPSGLDANNGLSWESAKKTVQAAVTAAEAGDEVWVSAGTYAENIDMKDGVALYGGFAGDEGSSDERHFTTNVTILDGSGKSSVIEVRNTDSDSTIIDGFTIRGGANASGGGIACYSAIVTISHNTIINNSTGGFTGGGIMCSGGKVIIANNLIAANSATDARGGGIYLGNVNGQSVIVNNTIASNTASDGGGIFVQTWTSGMQIVNNIIAYNSSGGLSIYLTRLGTDIFANNDLYGNSDHNTPTNAPAGLNNISKDPMFTNRTGLNFHLASDSPCINKGTSAARQLPDIDIDGQPRVGNGIVDIGADEVWEEASVTITTPTTDSTYITSASAITIGGTASNGVGSVTWATDKGLTGACTGTTSWTSSSIPLSAGRTVITVTADAVATTVQAVLTVIRDSAAPTVRITNPTTSATYITNGSTINIGGTASDDSGITQITWTTNHGGTGVCTGTTAWTANDIALTFGSNIIAVTATDIAGQTSTAVLTVTYGDTAPPAISIKTPTTEPTFATNQAKVTLTGTASDDIGVTIVTWSSDHGSTGICAGKTDWSVADIALTAGANVITVTASDAKGNHTAATLTINYDPNPPTIAIASPTTQATYSTQAAKLDISGTASDDKGVSTVAWSNDRGGTGACTGTTSWSATGIVLLNGKNVITVTATDAAGNTKTDTLTVTFTDTTAPSISITSPTSATTYTVTTNTVNIGGTASDNSAIASVKWVNNKGGSGNCTGTSSWTANNIALVPGINVITVTVTDAAGNTARDSIWVTFSDVTPPVVKIKTPTTNSSYSRTCSSVTIGGTATDNVGVANVSWSTNKNRSGTCTGTTTWSSGAITLSAGPNVITVTARDAANNAATATITVTYYEVSLADEWNGLTMVSVPIYPDSIDPQQIVNFDGNMWLAYKPVTSSYAQYPDKGSWFDPIELARTKGFWAYFSGTPSTPCGSVPPQDEPAMIHLYPGWNLIGQPFLTPVTWNTSQITARTMGGLPVAVDEARDVVANYLWGWNSTTASYYLICDPSLGFDAETQLQPWRAYWIKAYEECDLTIPGQGQ